MIENYDKERIRKVVDWLLEKGCRKISKIKEIRRNFLIITGNSHYNFYILYGADCECDRKKIRFVYSSIIRNIHIREKNSGEKIPYLEDYTNITLRYNRGDDIVGTFSVNKILLAPRNIENIILKPVEKRIYQIPLKEEEITGNYSRIGQEEYFKSFKVSLNLSDF